jgi:hypothetical protein
MSKFNSWMDKMFMEHINDSNKGSSEEQQPKKAINKPKSQDELDLYTKIALDTFINNVKMLEIEKGEKYESEKNIRTLVKYAIDKRIINMDNYLEKYIKNEEVRVLFKTTYNKIMMVIVENDTIIKRNSDVQNANSAINSYDSKMKRENKKYTTFSENMDKEVSPEDQNESLDHHMDNFLKTKLELDKGDKPVPQTEKAQLELKRQKEAYELKRKEYDNRRALLFDTINQYDSNKKKEDPNYKSFAETSKDIVKDDEDFNVKIKSKEETDKEKSIREYKAKMAEDAKKGIKSIRFRDDDKDEYYDEGNEYDDNQNNTQSVQSSTQSTPRNYLF